MSAALRYRDALDEMDETAAVGIKSAVEALAEGDDEIAAQLLHGTADLLDPEADADD